MVRKISVLRINKPMLNPIRNTVSPWDATITFGGRKEACFAAIELELDGSLLGAAREIEDMLRIKGGISEFFPSSGGYGSTRHSRCD